MEKLDLSKISIYDIIDPKEPTQEELDAKKIEDDKKAAEKKAEEDKKGDETKEEKEDREAKEAEALKKKEDDNKEELGLIEELSEKLGYEVKLEDFTDDIEGLTKFTKEVGEVIADEKLFDLFDRFPDVKEFLDFRMLGGDPDKFFNTKYQEIDYSKIEIKDDNEEIQKSVISSWLRAQEYEEDEIKKKLDKYETLDLLKEEAEGALKRLQKKQASDHKDLLTNQKKEAEKKKEDSDKFWGDVEKVITKSSTIKGFNLPEADKTKFFHYISKPVKGGLPQAAIDANEFDMETKLALEYLKFKKFNLKDLIEKEAKSQAATKLKERLTKQEDKTKSGAKDHNSTVDLSKLTSDTIYGN